MESVHISIAYAIAEAMSSLTTEDTADCLWSIMECNSDVIVCMRDNKFCYMNVHVSQKTSNYTYQIIYTIALLS